MGMDAGLAGFAQGSACFAGLGAYKAIGQETFADPLSTHHTDNDGVIMAGIFHQKLLIFLIYHILI